MRPLLVDVELNFESFEVLTVDVARCSKTLWPKNGQKSILFMNVQEYSKKFTTILIALKSSIILWGQKNDICASKKLEKLYGIRPSYSRVRRAVLPRMGYSDVLK